MKKKILASLLGTLMLSPIYLARAQQPKKVPRIGFFLVLLLRVTRTGPRHSGKGCEIWATLRGKTS